MLASIAGLQADTIAMTLRNFWLVPIYLLLSHGVVAAQQAEFLPETNVNLKLDSSVRLRGQLSNTREGGDPSQPSIGPDLQIYVKPLIRLERVTAFDLDDAKTRPLVISAGYRYLASPGSPTTNRMVLMMTSHFPLKSWLLLSDVN